jgi:CBS domain-containing protein/ribosome-associated translation inhibitor RaiA
MDVLDLKGIEINQLLVKDVMSQAAIVAKKGDTLSEVISKLKRDHIREVPVLDGDKPIGLVSYTSFLLRRSVPLSAKVEQVMRPAPRLEEDMSIPAAVEELMSAGVRGAPVVRNHKMVGFVSRTDVIKVLPQIDAIRSKRVSEFMSSNPQAVSEKESVRKAQMMMKGLMEKSLPVVDDGGRLVGAVSMSDVLDVLWSPKANKPANELLGGRERPEIAVGSVMSRPAVSVSALDTLDKVANVMIAKSVATVFVVEDSKLIGVVSQADLMEQVLSLKEKKGVYVQITGLGEEDPDVYDVMYDLIGKSMKRIDKIQFPHVFTVHVQVYNSEGMRSKFSLHGRLTTDHKMYYANATDWDLYKTLDELLNQLEKNIKKEHERVLDMRKKKQGS